MATTIDPEGTYMVSGADLQNCIDQAALVQSTLTSIEAAHTNYVLMPLHKQLNALALKVALAFGFESNTFGGNGTVTSTAPASGGTDKGA